MTARRVSKKSACWLWATTAVSFLLILSWLPGQVDARAILGIDLGSLYMKVALVQSGSPLEIVTNLHSKRKTEQMILFDHNGEQRFYGADAKSLLARKAHLTPTGMTLWLGKDDTHPTLQMLAERYAPLQPVYNPERHGLELTVAGSIYTPEELVAMVMEHAKHISVAHASAQGHEIAPPQDCVLTVPSYWTIHERRALEDAATLANFKVLTFMDENTASALQYAMDKTFEDGDQLILFYNLGASSLQVSLIHFFSYEQPQKYGKPKRVPALEVLAKAWDTTVGGNAWDALIVEYLADQFNAAYKTARKTDFDIRTNLRAMTKLQIQATKIKHVLSANTEFPVYMEALHDEVNLNTHMTRTQLEDMSKELLERAVKPVEFVLKQRENVTLANLTAVELIGGGMRVPSVQTALAAKLAELATEAGLDPEDESTKAALVLGMHLNSDESMALGAAFGGANISTAFRVRQVGLTDINPFGIQVTLSNLPSNATEEKGGFKLFGGGGDKKKEEKEGGEDAEAAAEWSKQTTIFKAFGKLGVKKTIAFTHDSDVHCELDYVQEEEGSLLPAGSEMSLERYNVTGVEAFAKEMAEKGLGKPKVSLQFELNAAGLTSLVRAEAAVEEIYTVQEEVEVEDEEDGADNSTTTADAEASADKESETADAGEDANTTEGDGTAGNETKPPKKTKLVEKEKKKTHRKALNVEVYHTGRIQPHSPEQLLASSTKLSEMAQRDNDRIMLEEARNKLESYIYEIKNGLVDHEDDIAKVTTEEQREEVQTLALAAEEWMDDEGYKADLPTLEDKYAELSAPYEKIKLRISESTARPAAVAKLQGRILELESVVSKWETSMPQITEEERTKVRDQLEEIRNSIEEMEKEQESKAPHEEPAFLSKDLPSKTREVEKLILKLSKKPKPKPEKKKSADNSTVAGNETESSESDEDGSSETKKEADADATEEGEPDEKATEEEANTGLPDDEL